jgi:hypothetical protein
MSGRRRTVRRCLGGLLSCLLWLPLAAGCTTAAAQAPSCTATERLALIAQSVPSSSDLPCLAELAPGWSTGQFTVRNGRTSFELRSDRAAGHPVRLTLTETCLLRDASPIAPRTPGGRSYLLLTAIEPRFQGELFDVFPGGCVSYRFDFDRGQHIALMAQLQAAVAFRSRQELRRELTRLLGSRLDP